MSRILIVDDNKANLQVAEQMVAAAGYESLCAVNGREAVTIYDKERPDLILMDLSMPEMDGFEAASEILGLQEGAEVKAPIIAMTAHSALTHEKKCRNAGFRGFLEKPISLDRVASVLSSFLTPAARPVSDATGAKA